MNLPLFIAGRYLFAKKSHNVINTISAISAIGMAIGTAALIIILSVYNGFDELIKATLSNVEPDILIVPSKGKVFLPEGEAFRWMDDNDEFSEVCHVLQDNVFIDYDGRQGIALAKGVGDDYEAGSPLASKMVNGEFSLHRGDLPQMVLGTGLAYRMGINPAFLAKAKVYYPSREKKFSAANPIASIESVSLKPSGIFSVSQQVDNELIIMPIEEMRNLLGHDKEISAIEIRLAKAASSESGMASGREVKKAVKELENKLGDDFKVQDRFKQNTSVYKMMRYEKAAIFMILIFCIIIIASNILGSLTMLIIEKKDDIETFRSLGAKESVIKRIFTLEGWLISLLGMALGLAVGMAFALIQQRFGLIKMPGDSFLMKAYPIILDWKDVAMTIAGVATIGYVFAVIPVKRNIR